MILAKKIPLCGSPALRLCVNKKNISRKEGKTYLRKAGAKIKTPLRLSCSAPLREQKKYLSQRREDAKIKTPLRLSCSAPLREQKKYLSQRREDLPAEGRRED